MSLPSHHFPNLTDCPFCEAKKGELHRHECHCWLQTERFEALRLAAVALETRKVVALETIAELLARPYEDPRDR